MNNFELGVLDFINERLSCPVLDAFMPKITLLANSGIFWIILAVIFLIIKKTRKWGFSMALALILGLIIGNIILKNAVGRIRPYDLNPDFNLLISPLKDFSFPSGHTLASFEGAVVLLKRDKRFGIPAIVLASIIAFSRLYLYVHYPSDVLAGVILGTLIALFSCYAVDKIYFSLKKQ